MSSLVFPSMAGLDIAIKRMPVYATKIQTASSGKELRASFQSTPRFRYSLPLNFLRQAVLNMDADEAIRSMRRRSGFVTLVIDTRTHPSVKKQPINNNLS